MIDPYTSALPLHGESGPLPASPSGRGRPQASEGRTSQSAVRSLPCSLLRLGRVEYGEAWALQRRLVEARHAEQIGDVLVLLEHPHVYTLGRRADETHVLANPSRLESIGAALYRIDRGGDVTYHGPGQLVGYPILDLKRRDADVHRYVDGLEEAIIRTLADYGIEGGRVVRYPGVWVGERKIAAIGVKVAHWITSHGFALNVDPDLGYFDEIVPCGLHDKGVTSMSRVLGRRVGVDEVAERLIQLFGVVFDHQMMPASLNDLLGA
jgi:lipoyl(octanoyl) transferase